MTEIAVVAGAAKEALGLLSAWRALEASERIRGPGEFRPEVLKHSQDLAAKTNRVLALFSPWGIETAFRGSSPDPPTLPERALTWIRRRSGRATSDDAPSSDDVRQDNYVLPTLTVTLLRDHEQLGAAVAEARPLLAQVRESAGAVVPPLGPASSVALERVLFVEDRLLLHATAVQRLGEEHVRARSAHALVAVFMLTHLARAARIHHEHLRELLTEDIRELTSAQPKRRLRKLQRQEDRNEKFRRDMTVRMLRGQAKGLDAALGGARRRSTLGRLKTQLVRR
jgi:hypothetical protein